MRNKKIYRLAFLLIAITISEFGYGQATSSDFNALVTTPNTPFNPGVDYLGWASGVSLDLNIKNEDAMPIKFYTNAGFVSTPKSPKGDFEVRIHQ